MSVDHYENFPVASFLCPAPLRPAVQAIYFYARTADDLADEGDAPAEQRLSDLRAYRDDLLRLQAGEPTSPRWAARVFEPLGRVMRSHRLPLPPLLDLLDAFSQDVVQQRYRDREELLDYCRRSANPIGRLLLHLYGIDDERSLRQSDAICTALQLINFWQDLSVDLPRDRLYVPLSDCAAHGLTPAQLFEQRDDHRSRVLVAALCDWAERLMLEGAPLTRRLPGRIGWELRWVVQGGLRIVHHLRSMDHACLRQRPKVGAADVPAILWRSLRM